MPTRPWSSWRTRAWRWRRVFQQVARRHAVFQTKVATFQNTFRRKVPFSYLRRQHAIAFFVYRQRIFMHFLSGLLVLTGRAIEIEQREQVIEMVDQVSSQPSRLLWHGIVLNIVVAIPRCSTLSQQGSSRKTFHFSKKTDRGKTE